MRQLRSIQQISPARRGLPPATVRRALALGLALAAALLAPRPAGALVRFDFDQAFYVHPERQVWDFSLIRADSLYHIFYHTIHELTPHSSQADTIWQATSRDLVHWSPPVPIIFSGTGAWDTSAVWAPDVFRDFHNQRWGLAYTGADAEMNQRLGFAFSSDLVTWTAAPNPVLEPDTMLYDWKSTSTWSDFRDPYLWWERDAWHLLLTAKTTVGVVYHAVSLDLDRWQDAGPIFSNDGNTPGRVLESVQYHKFGRHHHLLFGEFDTPGISHVSAMDLGALSMAGRKIIDAGYAPELDEFDRGIYVFSRTVPYPSYQPGRMSYVVRFDTLYATPDSTDLVISKPHPLDAQWEIHTGTACLGNPTFGDNPLWRGEASVGLVGNGYFGSQEYYQGPLAGRGAPGTALGGGATGQLLSRPFTVVGDTMTLLVGGGNDPENLYVALVDAAADTIIYRETGDGDPRLKPRVWYLRPWHGRSCRIRIVDSSTAPDGFINVDEIVEIAGPYVADVGPQTPPLAIRPRVVPNPFNPRTEIRFGLAAPARVQVTIHDMRGRRVWSDGGRELPAGPAHIVWDGRDMAGQAVAAGAYVYRVRVAGHPTVTGKLMLVK